MRTMKEWLPLYYNSNCGVTVWQRGDAFVVTGAFEQPEDVIPYYSLSAVMAEFADRLLHTNERF